MIVSSLYPRFRDLGDHLDGVRDGAVLRDADPVSARPRRARSHTLGELIAINPLTPILELARVWIIDPNAPYPGHRGRRAASVTC